MKKHASILFALAFIFSFACGVEIIHAQVFQGVLTFNPSVIKNGQAYTITMTNAPASSATRIWVDNGDGQGFVNFGNWYTTDVNGNLNISRTLDCSAYATLKPGQTLPVGNRVLTQKVYVEYVFNNGTGSYPSSTATLQADCTVSNMTTSPNMGGFPASEIAYQVVSSQGALNASYKFAPPIPNITFNQTNLSTYLGNSFKNIFWIASNYGGGPVGSWDISDPWNPKTPKVLGIAHGGSAFAVGGAQPATQSGPFFSGSWPHTPSLHFGGGSFADSATGEGRFVFASGEEGVDTSNPSAHPEPRGITPVISVTPGSGMGIGQLLNQNYQNLFQGVYATDASASGKFFFFGAGGQVGYASTTSAKNPLEIFDVTNLTGRVGYNDPSLNPISSQSWQNIGALAVVEVPGVRDHFLIGATTPVRTEKPTIYIGEINADSGTLDHTNSFTLDTAGFANGAAYTSAQPQPLLGSDIKFASVNGKTYVFMKDTFTPTSGSGVGIYGTLKIAAYQFDPSDLSLARKGDLSFNSFPANRSADKNSWDVVRDEAGSAYPLLMVVQVGQTKTVYDGYTNQVIPTFFNTNFFSLKNLIDSSTILSLIPAAPDISIPGEAIKMPITLGQIIIEGINQTHAFLKQEADRTKLYVYRPALLYTGRLGDLVMAYQEISGGASLSKLDASFRGVATMRVDTLDVTAFTGGVSIAAPVVAAPLTNQTACQIGKTLGVGSRGDTVKIFQQTLQSARILTGKVDGIYGPITAAAAAVYCGTPSETVITPTSLTSSPVINFVNGPASVSVNQSATWNMTASDPNNDDLLWGVNWGDQYGATAAATCPSTPAKGTGQNWSHTESHAWTSAGNYTVTVYASDCKNNTTKKSFVVTVR